MKDRRFRQALPQSKRARRKARRAERRAQKVLGDSSLRIMYDAVTAGNIPRDAQMAAGYVDGYYRNIDAVRAQCPRAVIVPIAVHSGTNDGVVADRETGDMSAHESVDWVLMRRRAGVDPTVYMSEAAWGEVRGAFQSRGVPEPHYWVAAYPGIGPSLYAGSVAHQYADPGPYDLSVVAPFWPGVDGPQEVDVTPDEHAWLQAINLRAIQTQQRLDDLTSQHQQDVWNSTLEASQTAVTFLAQISDTLKQIAARP